MISDGPKKDPLPFAPNFDDSSSLIAKLDSLRETINKVIFEPPKEPPMLNNNTDFGTFNADPPPHSVVFEAIFQMVETQDDGFKLIVR